MPYAPGIEYRGDRYLFEGISNLGAGIGGAIKQYRDTRDQSRAADAAFETLMAATAPMIQRGDVPPELAQELRDAPKFSGLSAAAKTKKLGQLGISLQMLMQDADQRERQQGRVDQRALQQSLYDLNRQEADRKAARQSATDAALRDAMPAFEMGTDNTGVGGSYIDAALANNPGADPSAILEALTKARTARRPTEQNLGADQMLEPFAIGGRKGLYNRRTGQTMLDADQGDGNAVPYKDEQGNVVAYGVKSGNRTQIVRPPGELTAGDRVKLLKEKASLNQLLTITQKPEDKAAVQSQIAEIDAELAKGKGEKAATPPPATGAPAKRRRYNPATGRLDD